MGFSNNYEQEVEVTGHLIDSMILTKIMDTVMDLKGEFEVLEFKIGKRKGDYSYAKLLLRGRDKVHLSLMLKEIYKYGATPIKLKEVRYEPSPKNGVLPDNFYSTTNNPTYIYLKGSWIEVKDLMMDKPIIVEPDSKRAYCKPILEVKKGDLIVVGEEGIKVLPPERPREGTGIFEFMSSRTSSEKPVTSIAKMVAYDLIKNKRDKGKTVVVGGPAIVHTGAVESFSEMIKRGYVDILLAGNALAVHDVEYALFGTSLGIDVATGMAKPGGHKNHMAAINEIIKAGSLREAVEKGVLKSGIFYECIKNDVPYILAGSIRDDGPIPDVITDVVEAQRRYREALRGATIVLMLSTMLHSIAVGNMLPSTVKVIAIDINHAAVTKLLDRGTGQAIGIISDVGTFLPLLNQNLKELEKEL
ncbi:MAG: TIGR00300 family protein [Nitrososphaerales archaeon]